MSPRSEPHRHAVRKLVQVLALALPPGLIVPTQDAVAVPDWHNRDAPESDVAVLTDAIFRPGPRASDARAFIEVRTRHIPTIGITSGSSTSRAGESSAMHLRPTSQRNTVARSMNERRSRYSASISVKELLVNDCCRAELVEGHHRVHESRLQPYAPFDRLK